MASAPTFTAMPVDTAAAALQSLLDGLIEAACVIDAADLRVCAANAAAAALWQRPLAGPGALVGTPVTELVATPEDACFWLDRSTACGPAADVAPLHSDSLIVRADGSTRAVERRIGPVTLPDGRPGWLLSLVDQHAAQHLHAELDRLAAELGATLDSSHDALLVTDLDGAVRGCNAAFATLWQLPAAACAGDGARLSVATETVEAHIAAALADPAADRQRLLRHQTRLRSATPGTGAGDIGNSDIGNTGSARSATDRLRLRDGRTFERRLVPQYARGLAIGWLQVWRDLSAELAQQARLQLAGQVFETTLDALLVTDAQHRVVGANPLARRLIGLAADDLDGAVLPPLVDLLSAGWTGGDTAGVTAGVTADDPTDRARPGRPGRSVAATLLQLGPDTAWQGELTLAGATGPIPVHAHLIRLGAAPGEPDGACDAALASTPRGCLAVLRDLREQRAHSERLHELARTDALTGLPNRLRLEDRLGAAIEACASTATPTVDGFALLVVGLDRLQHINDSLGHAAGDRVLVEAARRLGAGVRAGDSVARLGGDAFAVLLQRTDAAATEPVARRLLAALAEPLAIDGVALTLRASIGIALHPSDGADADALLMNADSAMHRVKQGQGGDLRFYRPQMNRDLLERMRLDHAMRQALPRGAFSLHYQPQVDLASGAVIGAEALCRWRDAEHGGPSGEVSPGRFIGVAEETGFIAELGQWVLATAVAQAARWHAEGRSVPVSVNVSALQFQAPGFVERVRAELARHDLPAALLELELTESILVGEIGEVIAQLQQLRDLGVKLAIDDFGTGYSSLRYLKRLPIHRLKIDREFIRTLDEGDSSDAEITRSIVQLGRALGLTVIGEGVETVAQRDRLAQLGCHEYQGFLYGRPVPADVFAATHGGRIAEISNSGSFSNTGHAAAANVAAVQPLRRRA